MADPMDVDAPPTTRDASSLPWVEKYRPSSLDELISHESIITTLNNLVESGRLPHLLFYGPPGTGKTSTCLALARKLNGPGYKNMVLELNASDERKIDVVRDQIKEFASTKMIFDKGVKLVILDEADAMTNDAQAALRREMIITAENLNVTQDGKAALLKLASGDMRKVLNVLQATSMAYEIVNEENVYLCTGNPLPRDIRSIMDWMLNEDFKTALKHITELKIEKGVALQDILRDVHELLIRMELDDKTFGHLLVKMSEIEHRITIGATEKLQLSALVAAFQQARDMIASE